MSSDKSHILLAAGIGLIVSDIIPTPADALYFKLEQKWKAELEDGIITPKQYWTKTAVAYYSFNPLWWSLVVGSSIALGKSFKQQMGILSALLAGGALIAVLGKNIDKDNQRYDRQD